MQIQLIEMFRRLQFCYQISRCARLSEKLPHHQFVPYSAIYSKRKTSGAAAGEGLCDGNSLSWRVLPKTGLCLVGVRIIRNEMFIHRMYTLYFSHWNSAGTHGCIVGWRTMLQDGRSRVRFPTKSWNLSIVLILPSALWPWIDSASNRNE
jgi:hypothetical protein